MKLNLRRWLWPEGMAGQLTLLLVVLLMLALWIGTGIYVSNRAETAVQLFKESVAQRIGVIVPLVERTPHHERETILRALHSPTLRIRTTDRAWQDRRPQLPPEPGSLAEDLHRRLPDLGGRAVQVRTFGHWRGPPLPRAQDGSRAPAHDLLHSRAKVRVSVALQDGGWIHFMSAAPALSFSWALRKAFWMAAGTVVVLGIVFWASFRMTRPLRRFAHAAERIGMDVRSPALDEAGSRELRNAARAFNQMQERLRHLVDDRTMMLAAISHDLRTVLTRLRLRSEFIADGEQRRKAIADLDDMQSMLDSTLTFARDDAADEARVATDLAALVRSLCDDLADVGERIACGGPDRVLVTCAPRAIRRAIGNVLTNALRYGRQADVEISSGEQDVTVAVADRGPGIPPHRREDAFRPFHRLDAARGWEGGGSGLGLAVARSVVRRHGGDIVMSDRQGGGLVVSVFLPHGAGAQEHREA